MSFVHSSFAPTMLLDLLLFVFRDEEVPREQKVQEDQRESLASKGPLDRQEKVDLQDELVTVDRLDQ